MQWLTPGENFATARRDGREAVLGASALRSHTITHLIALACGEAPEGRARWTLRLLADRLVECEIVEADQGWVHTRCGSAGSEQWRGRERGIEHGLGLSGTGRLRARVRTT